MKFQRVPITERNLGLAHVRRVDSRHMDRPSLSIPHNARHGTALDLARPPGPLGVGPLFFLGPVARRKAPVLGCGVWAHVRVRQNDVRGLRQVQVRVAKRERHDQHRHQSTICCAAPAFTAKANGGTVVLLPSLTLLPRPAGSWKTKFNIRHMIRKR
ncbi:hypothetical protein BC828DRAFT_374891 [Blastocladiella britannica]|nr:hypothetical protein BC828DRAFT_374891 [Blastocladiella britannica]